MCLCLCVCLSLFFSACLDFYFKREKEYESMWVGSIVDLEVPGKGNIESPNTVYVVKYLLKKNLSNESL